MLLGALCDFKAVRYLFSFLRTVIIVRGLVKGKVATFLVNYKVILF